MKAGFGVRYFAEIDFTTANSLGDRATDLGGSVGIGYDLRTGARFALTPFLQVSIPLTRLSTNGGEPDDWNLTLWQVGLSFTWTKERVR
jgi:hypothetical protein